MEHSLTGAATSLSRSLEAPTGSVSILSSSAALECWMGWISRLLGWISGNRNSDRANAQSGKGGRLPVIHHDCEFVPNPSPPGMPFKAFVKLHRDMERICGRFGRVGGGGVGVVSKPDFYLIWGDYYGLDHKYLYLQVCDPTKLTEAWLRAVAITLRRHPGWGIGVQNCHEGRTLEGYILVFADRVMVSGTPFKSCSDLASLARTACAQRHVADDEQ